MGTPQGLRITMLVLFVDDGQVADLALSKRWAAPGREGATITITEAA